MASRSIEFDIVGNDKATGKLRNVKTAISELGDRIGKMFTATALFDRGLGLLEQGFSTFVQTLKDTAGLKDQATAAGLTTEEYQRLAIAAEDAGLSQEQMMKGLKNMKEALRDARVEGSRQAQVLLALGYTQQEISDGSISAMDAMNRLSGAVQAARTPQEKYNIAAAIFGAKAQELVPLLDNFRDAMARASQEMIVSDENINRLDDTEKRLNRIVRQWKSLGLNLFAERGVQMTGRAAGSLVSGGTGEGMGAIAASIGATIFGTQNGGPAPIPVSEKDKAAAAALGKLGMAAATGGASGMAGVSSAQSLGMATSIALAQQQTNYLATIAANTSPSMGGALPGQTNITRPDATAAELRDTYAAIRYTTSPTSKTPRPAR